MALDPNVGHIVKFMEKEIPGYKDLIHNLSAELQSKLNGSKVSLPELFHKVAVRYLNTFTNYCKYYSRYSILYVKTRSKFITDYYWV